MERLVNSECERQSLALDLTLRCPSGVSYDSFRIAPGVVEIRMINDETIPKSE